MDDGPFVMAFFMVILAGLFGTLAGCDTRAVEHCKATTGHAGYRIDNGRIVCQQIVDVPEK